MITQDEKEQIFALYWMQRVGVSGNGRREILCDEDFIPYLEDDGQLHLELKPLSSITDEDAIRCFTIIQGNADTKNLFAVLSKEKAVFECKYLASKTIHFAAIDFLRSRGYALPAFGHSVDELVKEGVFKLIEP